MQRERSNCIYLPQHNQETAEHRHICRVITRLPLEWSVCGLIPGLIINNVSPPLLSAVSRKGASSTYARIGVAYRVY